MDRAAKQVAIEEITTEIKDSDAIFVVDYRGLTVPQAAELRGQLREADTSLRIVKNTLTQRAADAADAEDLKPLLVGPTAIAFVRGDAALAAKALAKAQKDYEILEFKGGILSGKSLTVDELKALAKLPSRDVLIGQLVGLAASPLGGVVRTLGGFIGGLASQLGQIRDQGLVGQGAAPAEEPAAEEPAAGEQAAEEPAAEEPAAEEPVAEEPVAEASDADAGEQEASAEGDAGDGDDSAGEETEEEGDDAGDGDDA